MERDGCGCDGTGQERGRGSKSGVREPRQSENQTDSRSRCTQPCETERQVYAKYTDERHLEGLDALIARLTAERISYQVLCRPVPPRAAPWHPHSTPRVRALRSSCSTATSSGPSCSTRPARAPASRCAADAFACVAAPAASPPGVTPLVECSA